MKAEEVKEFLKLVPLPGEGGYYRETYRSSEKIAAYALPERYTVDKYFGSAIYYLLTPETCSIMHRLPSDEIYHFYLGDPVEMLILHEDNSSENVVLGTEIFNGQNLQYTVPAGCYQGSSLVEGGKFALLGTTVAPAFDFIDFESGNRTMLVERFPQLAEQIIQLTK